MASMFRCAGPIRSSLVGGWLGSIGRLLRSMHNHVPAITTVSGQPGQRWHREQRTDRAAAVCRCAARLHKGWEAIFAHRGEPLGRALREQQDPLDRGMPAIGLVVSSPGPRPTTAVPDWWASASASAAYAHTAATHALSRARLLLEAMQIFLARIQTVRKAG